MSEKSLALMKPWVGILGGLLVLALMWAGPAMARQPETEERQVRELIQKMAQGYLKKDMKALLAVAADDAELVVEGLAGTASHKGREKIRAAYAADLKALGSPTLSIIGLNVKAQGGMARATVEVMAGGRVGREQVAMPARLSLLLEKRGGKWAVYFAQVRYPLLRPEFDQLLGR